MPQMSQSGMIGAALIAGFVLWLAANGKLQTYWNLLLGQQGGSSGSTPAAGGPMLIPSAPSIGFPGLSVNPFQGLPGALNPMNVPDIFANPPNPATGQ